MTAPARKFAVRINDYGADAESLPGDLAGQASNHTERTRA